MQNILLFLSLAGKAFAFVAGLNFIPGVPPSEAVIIFFTASVLKDVCNRFYDFIQSHPTGISSQAKTSLVAAAAVLSLSILGLTACNSSTGSTPTPAASGGTVASTPSTLSTVSADLVKSGEWVANILQTKNDGGTTLATQLGDVASDLLVATHNGGDAQEAALAASLLNKASAAASTAASMGATPTQQQAAVNAQLTPAAVVQAAQATAVLSPQ